MAHRMGRRGILPVACLMVFSAACGGSGSQGDQQGVTVEPPSASVPPLGSAAFSATVSASAATGVSWSVREGASGGTISPLGLYTAPSTLGTYTVVATSVASPSVSGTAAVTVESGGGGSAPVLRLAASTWLNYVNVASMTTPTFSSPGSPRVFVAVVSWYPPFDDPPPTTVRWVGGTPAGKASDWQMVVRSYDGTIHWCSEIWWATSTQPLTNVSVVATRSGVTANNNSTGILAVYEVTGARTTWGASAEHHSPMSEVSQDLRTSVVDVPITATAAGSQIIGISQYGDYYDMSSANALTTIDYQQHDGGGDGGAAAWHKTTTTAAGAPYTLGVTLPGGNTRAFSGCAVELLAQ